MATIQGLLREVNPNWQPNPQGSRTIEGLLKDSSNVELPQPKGYIDSAWSGFKSGVANVYGGIADLLHLDSAGDYAQDIIQRNRRDKEFDTVFSMDYLTDPAGFTYDLANMGGSVASMAPIGMTGVGGAAGAAAARLIPGFLGRIGAGALANRAATKAGQEALVAMGRGASTAPIEGMAEGGNVRRDAIAEGLDNPDLRAWATVAANIPTLAASNALEYGIMLGKLFRPAAKEGEKLATRAWKAPLRAAPGAGVEAAQNAGEEFIQQTISDYATDQPIGTPLNPTDRQRMAGEVGFITGGGMGMISNTPRAMTKKQEQANPAPPQPRQGHLDTGHEDIDRIVSEAAKRYNLPPELIHQVIQQESGYNPKAVSEAGAQGIMQLMPDTAKALGVTDPFDVAQNIDGGAKYLRQMLDQFNGETRAALAAYNAGPNNMWAGLGYADEVMGRTVNGKWREPANADKPADIGAGMKAAREALAGKSMDNGKNGCVEAVTKILSHVHPEFAQMVKDGVVNTDRGKNSLWNRLKDMGVEIVPFDEEGVAQGDIIFYDDPDGTVNQHVLVADHKAEDGKWRVFGNSSSANQVKEQDLHQGQIPKWIAKVSALGGAATGRQTTADEKKEEQPDYSAPEMKADDEYKLASEPMDSTKQFLGGEQQTGTAPDINADTPETDALFASFLQNFMETSTDANKMDAASRMLNPKGKFISTQANRDAVRATFPDELAAYVNTQTPKQVQNTPKTAQSQTAPRTTAPQTTTQSISGANHAVMLDAQRQQQEQQRAQQQSARQQAQDAIQSQRIGEMRGAMAQTAQMPPEAQREQFAMQAVAGNMEDRIRQGKALAAIAKAEGVTFRKGVGKALESGAEKAITAAQEDIRAHRGGQKASNMVNRLLQTDENTAAGVKQGTPKKTATPSRNTSAMFDAYKKQLDNIGALFREGSMDRETAIGRANAEYQDLMKRSRLPEGGIAQQVMAGLRDKAIQEMTQPTKTADPVREEILAAMRANPEVRGMIQDSGGIDAVMKKKADAEGMLSIVRAMEQERTQAQDMTPEQAGKRLAKLRKERQQEIDDEVARMRRTPGGQGTDRGYTTNDRGEINGRWSVSRNPQWYQDAYKKYGRKPKVSEYPDIAVDTLSKMQHFSERDAEIARLEELQRQGKEARAAAKQPQAAKQEQTAPQEAQPQTARTETETDTSRTAPAQEAAQTAEKEAQENPAPAKEEQGEARKPDESQTKAASKSEPSAPTTKGRETKYKAVTYDVPTETLDAVSKRYNIQGYRENGKNTTVFFDSEKDSKRFFDAYKDDALEEAQAETEQEPEATQNETRTEPEAPIKTETKQEPAPQDVASKATKAEQGERIFGDRDTANREMLEALGLTEEELEDEILEAPPGIENTAEERERLERELAEELNKLGANPVFNPKIYTLGLKLAMTYVKDGINTVKKLIAKLNTKFGDNITPWAAAIAETVNTWPKGVAFDEKRVMAISKAIGAAYEDGHTYLDDVQGEMQKLLKGKHKQFAPMIEASYNGIKKFFDDKEAAENVDDSTRGLAARAGEWANQDAVGRDDESGGPRRGSEREGVQAADDDAQPQRSVRVRDGSPASRGETGDSGVQAKESEDRTDSAGSVELSGSVVDSLEGSMALDRGGEAEDIGTSQDGRNDATPQKIKKNVPYKAGDLDSVKADLPMLLPAQQEDVVFAEKRLDENGGAGVLFTNGTGTGKTFTGLGIVKRMYERGKKNILIVSPTNDINNAWIKAAKEHFGLDIKPLADTKDGGKEKTIAITTYANFRQNKGIAKRNWDAVIADESHNLMNNKDGSETAATSMLRALTMNVRGIYRRARELFRTDTIANLEDEIADIEEAMSNLGTGKGAYLDEKKYGDILRKVDGMTLEATKKYLQSCIDDRQNKIDAAYDKMNMREKRERLEKEIAAMPQEEKPKVVFLSATPFSYDKDVDYAEGYLFDYDKKDGIASGRDDFMIKNFGYRMRYNKLTRPDAEVDNRVMEVAFHDKLVNDGVMSGRMLEVDADYDRGFILVDSGIGKTIDEGFQWLRENKKYEDLFEVLNKRFTRRNRRYLLESIKAKEAVPLIREYIKNGKKVVLFHQAMMEKKNFHPFKLTDWRGKDDEHTQRIRELWEDFDAERPDLAKLKLSDIPSPMETIKAAFGTHGLYVDGKTSKKAKAEAINKFNDDNSSSRLIVVQQDAGNAGISLHDVTGKFPRVLINIATPERPSYAMQIEGRIYRVGNKSNATFRYLSTGMDIEKELFANTIGSRAETVENLALGDMARGLTDSFTNLYMETMDGSWERRKPGHPEEGTGGKEMDITKTGMSLFDMAKSFYFAQQKKTSRTKAQEGQDYFATPEPIGMKMVEWLGLEAGDRALEPSAGHGAISRWFSPNTKNTIVEPSRTLSPLAQMVTPDAKTVTGRFEDFNIVNKFEGIAMNPPFGHGGKTAVEHLAKAYKHLANGGRMVAIIPEGPAADKQFEKWMDSDDAENASIAATIHLPGVTFGRAGTNVATKIVIIDKNVEDEGTEDIDLRDAKDINELFDRIENLAAPSRPKALPTGKSKAKEKDNAEERDSYDAEIDGHKLTVTKDGRISGDTYPVKNTIKKYGARWDRDRKEWVIGDEEDLELFLDDFATEETAQEETRTEKAGAEETNFYTKDDGTPRAMLKDRNLTPHINKCIIELAQHFSGDEMVLGVYKFPDNASRDKFIEAADALLSMGDAKFSVTAWHGTGANFERFSLDHIGEGEGAQVHGWGLYFAGERKTSEEYREKLTSDKSKLRSVVVDGKKYTPGDFRGEWKDATGKLLPYENSTRYLLSFLDNEDGDRTKAAEEIAHAATYHGITTEEGQFYQNILDVLQGKGRVRVYKANIGSLLQVEIPDADVMLDEQKTIGKQSPKTKANLQQLVKAEKYLKRLPADFRITMSETGEKFYQRLADAVGSPKAASLLLNKYGIEGITYMGGRDGRCYVVFDDNAIDIIGRFSKAQTKIANLLKSMSFPKDDELTSQQKEISAMGEEMGTPVVWFDGPAALHGFHQNNVTFLNRKSGMDVQKVFYHEAFHYLKNNNDGMYRELVDEIQKAGIITKEQLDAYRERTGRLDLIDADAIEEMLADEFENPAKRAGILQSIAKQNQGLVERFIAWIKDMIDRIAERFNNPQGKLTTDQRKAFVKAFGRMVADITDKDGKRIFSTQGDYTRITRADGGKLARPTVIDKDRAMRDNIAQKVFDKYLNEGIMKMVRDTVAKEIGQHTDLTEIGDPANRDLARDMLPYIRKMLVHYNQLTLRKGKQEYLDRLATKIEYARRCFDNDNRIRREITRSMGQHAGQGRMGKAGNADHARHDGAGSQRDSKGSTVGIFRNVNGARSSSKKHFERLYDQLNNDTTKQDNEKNSQTTKRADNPGASSMPKFSVDLSDANEGEQSYFHKLVDKLGNLMGIRSDKVITEDKGKSPDGISLPQYYLGSPSRIAERVKAFRLFFRMGDNAMNTLTKMRSDFQKKLDRAMKNVGKKEDRDRLYEILWTGDAEGKEFTDAEMREMGVAENVIKAYHGIRQIMRQSYNKLNEARKRPVSHSRRLTNEEINELKKNKFLIGIQSIGDAEDGKRLVTWKEYKHWDKTYDVDAATLEKFKADDAMQVLAEKENEDGSYHVHVREGIGDLANRGGYIPHFFHEYMIRLTDKDGNPIDRIGYGGVIGSGRTEAEAIQKAEAWEKEHRGELKEGEVVRVAPKVFSFGRLGMDDQQYAAIVGDKDYEKMARSIAKSHGMTLKEAREHLKGTARMKNRHRFFGNLLKRQGAKGFEQEMGWVLRHYLNGVSRYYALETEFKPKAISLYERLYGDYAKDAATKEAQYVKDYIHDINGDPTWLEKGLNDLLNRSSIYRNFIAAKFGDRAALRLTSSVSNTVSQLTLGMLNASSALLNLTQVMNSAAYIGDVSALGKCIAKGAQRRYNMRDMRVLAETNVLNDIGLDSGAGYDKARSFGNILNRIGNKGMVLFKATESAIRRGTVLAAYDKAIKDGKTHDEAIAFAKDVNRKSNFDYGVADAPNIFRRGSILSQLALQFKKYSFKELEVMADMLSNKSSRKQKAIFWGTYLLMCGLCGIPALDIWDDWFGGKDTMQKFIMEAAGDTPEGKALGRVAMYGLFAAVPGIDISNRAGMSDVVPTKASDLTGPLVSKTANLIRDFGNGAAMIRDISPGVYNQYAAWVDEREKDKRGRTIVTYDDVYDKMLRAMGFNSTEKRVGMDVQRIVRNERSELTAEKQEAVDEFIRNPTTENAMRLKELGIKPKTVQNERARKKADRMERLASGMNKDERQQYQSLLQFAQ